MAKKIRTYSTEFKAEAVKKIADNNGNISATAKQLGIAVLEENKHLKRQLKVAKKEREILKKVKAYFAKHS